MSASVEERLRAALAQQAETTTTAPDGWRRIQARIDHGRRRRPAFLRWTLLAPAAALVTVVAVVLAAFAGDGGRTVRVTGGTEPLYLVPTGVEPRFSFVEARSVTPPDPVAPWSYRAFGRRAPDGVALDASVIVTIPGDRARNGATLEPTLLTVLGRDLQVGVDPFGQRSTTWTQGDGRPVGVLTFGLSQAELVEVVESLLPGDAARDMPSLPSGFIPVGSGEVSGGALAMTMQTWKAHDGGSFTVSVAEGPGSLADDMALWMPGGRAVEVRGKSAIYLEAGGVAYLAWSARPGTSVTLQGHGLSEQDLVTIARGLREVNARQWRQLVGPTPAPPAPEGPPVASGPLDVPPPPGVRPAPQPDGYFLLLPVRGQFAPPCTRMVVGAVLPERRDGQDVACYQVANPVLDAGEVASASVVQDRTAGTWSVELTLTAEGARRFDQLFRDAGAGAQFGIVVDGQLVSVPRFGDAPPAGKGVVTGLDEQTARNLAGRLGR